MSSFDPYSCLVTICLIMSFLQCQYMAMSITNALLKLVNGGLNVSLKLEFSCLSGVEMLFCSTPLGVRTKDYF